MTDRASLVRRYGERIRKFTNLAGGREFDIDDDVHGVDPKDESPPSPLPLDSDGSGTFCGWEMVRRLRVSLGETGGV